MQTVSNAKNCVFNCCGYLLVKRVTVAMADGPARRGVAIGTINGSFSKELTVKDRGVLEGNNMFKEIKNKSIPPVKLRISVEILNFFKTPWP